MPNKKIALVTGAYRGLGFEVCRKLAETGYEVILTARDSKKGEPAAEELKQLGLSVKFHELDVTDPNSIDAILFWVEKEYGRLDLLVNNAAVLLDREKGSTDKSTLSTTLETNVTAAYLLSEKAAKLMKNQGGGRIVNVSSQMGQMASMASGYDAYRISKAALNAVTKILASEWKGSQIQVNSVCPGWCRTDMGGDGAPLSTDDGAKSIVWVTQQENTGRFYQNYKEIVW
jgi:NAD(P)-dependent dehydrogenase (short-subunit alcohol dehydrogenase family)